MNKNIVITGIGIVSPSGIGKEAFWKNLQEGKDTAAEVVNFNVDDFSVNHAAEVRNFKAADYLEAPRLRHLDRSALMLLTAAKLCLDDAGLKVSPANTDDVGIVTGTTFSHLWPTMEFDKEVFKETLDFASPALFPSTVLNATSSHVSIYFNAQGFNTTVCSGYTSFLEALRYGMLALATGKAKHVLVGCVEALSYYLYGGFFKLGYMAGVKGEAISCPFDKRHNGPVLGEAAAVFLIEEGKTAKERQAKALAKVLSVESFFDAHRTGKVHPNGEGFEKAVRKALNSADISASNVDYISACANSTVELDRIEVKVMKKVFANRLKDIPMSSIKSMLGETISASAGLQTASGVGAMQNGFIAPTINHRDRDPECDIDCVPNIAREKKVKCVLVNSFGPGAFNSAAVISNYHF